ncbi:hypothetical protein LLG46_04435 [bacterium]|nr:hypothetical protein [bacterium]
MKRALIDPAKCNNCSPCLVEQECPMEAVFRELQDSKPWVDFYRCAGCMKCKAFCANHAIEEIAHPCDGKGRMGW